MEWGDHDCIRLSFRGDLWNYRFWLVRDLGFVRMGVEASADIGGYMASPVELVSYGVEGREPGDLEGEEVGSE